MMRTQMGPSRLFLRVHILQCISLHQRCWPTSLQWSSLVFPKKSWRFHQNISEISLRFFCRFLWNFLTTWESIDVFRVGIQTRGFTVSPASCAQSYFPERLQRFVTGLQWWSQKSWGDPRGVVNDTDGCGWMRKFMYVNVMSIVSPQGWLGDMSWFKDACRVMISLMVGCQRFNSINLTFSRL